MAARLRQGMRRHCRPSPASSGAFTDGKFPLDSSQTGGARAEEKEARVALLGLGYAGFGSDGLEDWRQFLTRFGGLGGGGGGRFRPPSPNIGRTHADVSSPPRPQGA